MRIRKNIFNIIVAVSVVQINSCTYDRKTDVAIIKNNLKANVLIVDQPDEILTDSSLYYDYLTQMETKPNESTTISIPVSGFQNATNNEKVFIYVFTDDSLVKYKSQSSHEGIVKKALVKKIDIQLNQVKHPLDTIKIP